MQDFYTLNQVIGYSKEALVVDLLDHVMALDDQYLSALIEPHQGIYLVGGLSPIFPHNHQYWVKHQPRDPELAIPWDKLLLMREDIVDKDGQVVITRKDMLTKAKFMRNEPSIPVVGVKMAIAISQHYLNAKCRHNRFNFHQYKIDDLVKPAFEWMIHKEEFLHGFKKLLDMIDAFIKDDDSHIYFYKVKGTSMVIEKGVDYRILRYYEDKFARENMERDNEL